MSTYARIQDDLVAEPLISPLDVPIADCFIPDIAVTYISVSGDGDVHREALAERMGTKQEVIARWEGGTVIPSTRTVARLAKATGTRLLISFAPSQAVGE